jgi:hypothetical protein
MEYAVASVVFANLLFVTVMLVVKICNHEPPRRTGPFRPPEEQLVAGFVPIQTRRRGPPRDFWEQLNREMGELDIRRLNPRFEPRPSVNWRKEGF